MLQSVRDNLKGTVAVIVIILFIIPMVLSGVGGSFLGSAAGTDAATVNGESISKMELNREVYAQKQRILAQDGVDPASDFLKDENLTGPVLDRLTRRTAMLVAAREGGMSISDQTINKIIIDQQDFYVDGKFDPERYRQLLASNGFTPASYREVLKTELLMEQQAKGMTASGFVTQAELDAIVSVIDETRSFYSIKIPAEGVREQVTVSDAEVEEYYNANQQAFVEPEKLTVDYLELSVDKLAEDVEVAEADLRAQFEQELKAFSNQTEYQIAHLLISDENNANVEKVSERLAAGDDFATLVEEFSEDEGSKAAAGDLGVLTPGVYPEEFETAVYALEEGEVSPPVVTDAGTHFIKVTRKIEAEPPTYEERKDVIANQLKRIQAETTYVTMLDQLGEYTFSAGDLASASEQLNLEIKTSPLFQRDQGTGVANNQAFRDAAFSSEVLVDGQNSNVIELSNDRAVVLRKNTHEPEHIKPLEQVREQIVTTLTDQKVEELQQERANTLIASLKTAEDIEQVVKELGYELNEHQDVKRSDASVDRNVLSAAFAMSKNGKYDSVVLNNNDYAVIGLTNVSPGSVDKMPEQRLKGLIAQLNRENANYALNVYQDQVFETAEVEIH